MNIHFIPYTVSLLINPVRRINVLKSFQFEAAFETFLTFANSFGTNPRTSGGLV